MIRTQVQLEERQYEQVRRLAHRKRISMSEAVRRLLGKGLRSKDKDVEEPTAGSLLDVAGIGRSGLEDLGRNHDRYLDEDTDR